MKTYLLTNTKSKIVSSTKRQLHCKYTYLYNIYVNDDSGEAGGAQQAPPSAAIVSLSRKLNKLALNLITLLTLMQTTPDVIV